MHWSVGIGKDVQSPVSYPACFCSLSLLVLDSFLFFFFSGRLAGSYPSPSPPGPAPGIEPEPPTVKTLSPNHWTAREFPHAGHFDYLVFLKSSLCIINIISVNVTAGSSAVIC